MLAFLRSTLVGGLFVVVPVTLVVFVLGHTVASLRAAMAPVAHVLPFEAAMPGLWAVLALLLLSFGAGLLLRIPPLRRWAIARREQLAERFPIVRFLRGVHEGMVDASGRKPLKPALVETGDGLVPAFVVEELPDGRCVVFVPAVPSVLQGAVYIVEAGRVHLVDASIGKVGRCISQWGIGARELVAAMRKPA
jgi:uncharacterized membrane protein